jgi:outer membrane autotransporter protein
MFVRSLARASTVFSALVGALLAVLMPTAHAAPPVITGSPVTAQMPNFNDPAITINLRELGVIAGSAPLLVQTSQLQVTTAAGGPTGLIPAIFANNGPGHVCITIRNNGNFTVTPGQTFQLTLIVTNLANDLAGPITVPITNTPGNVVDTTAEQAACDDRNSPPTANAGPDQRVNDTDGAPGENVTLDGSASTDPDPGSVLIYEWIDIDNNLSLSEPSSSPTLAVNLGPGVHNIRLSLNDDSSDPQTNFSSDTVVITVEGPAAPTADAGPDQTLNDTNGLPGEPVTLNGSGSSDPDGTIATYQWVLAVNPNTNQPLGTGQTITVNLPDGTNDVRLTVTDNAGITATDAVTVIVNAAQSPTANAGADRDIPDSDGQAGESVTLDASATADPGNVIGIYRWFRLTGSESQELLGEGRTLTVTLPDGRNDILLELHDRQDNFVGGDFVVINVAAPPPATVLSDIPGLTPNQSRMANKLDSMCDALAQLSSSEAPLTGDQVDLLTKCNGIRIRTATNGVAQQVEAIQELIPDDFSVARTQTLLFANTQYASIMDRLMALRGGARGLSLAGLNIVVDGKMVPLAQIEDMVKQFFGGGASADGSAADEPGGLLSDKWGLWARGNFSFGEKDQSATSPAFDADQWAFVGGLDYRLSDKAVLGAALSYGSSSVDFKSDEGSLDTDSFSLSVYGSAYAAKNFYFDGIVNFQNSSYDAFRNITYVDGIGLVNVDASGDTDGTTLSGGFSAGYDFLAGGLTISPNLGFFYIDTTIDGFTESGAAGLNLIYDEQQFKSMTGNAGLRLTYAWNVSWGVLLPHLRVDYVREFEDDVDVFGVRFANDPNAASTPPVLVATDNPDTSYWRLAGGFSAQFKHGISGYVEYQRLESFEFISFQDVSIGLRFQRSF